MSYQLKVIKDYPIGFWPLDESSGSTASDISGCGNNGTYHGSPATNILPITCPKYFGLGSFAFVSDIVSYSFAANFIFMKRRSTLASCSCAEP